jgi:Reverse transcriptase (RNA-dependent DNA polymerase)
MLAVYVNDMIITGDNEEEITQLKARLKKKFEVKDLRQFRYFFGIEIDRGAEEIVLFERKYVLDLLTETSMLGCRPAVSPIDVKSKIGADAGE